MAPDDRALIERVARGDESAFGELVGRYQGRLFTVAHRLLGNRADAEDAVGLAPDLVGQRKAPLPDLARPHRHQEGVAVVGRRLVPAGGLGDGDGVTGAVPRGVGRQKAEAREVGEPGLFEVLEKHRVIDVALAVQVGGAHRDREDGFHTGLSLGYTVRAGEAGGHPPHLILSPLTLPLPTGERRRGEGPLSRTG